MARGSNIEDLTAAEDLGLIDAEHEHLPRAEPEVARQRAVPEPVPVDTRGSIVEPAGPVADLRYKEPDEIDDDPEQSLRALTRSRPLDVRAGSSPRQEARSERSLELLREQDRAADTGELTGAHRLRALQRALRRKRNLQRLAGSGRTSGSGPRSAPGRRESGER